MNFEVTISGYGRVSFSSRFPEEMAEHYIEGSKVYTSEDLPFGRLLIQQYKVKGFVCWHVVFVCHREAHITIRWPYQLLKIHLLIKGNLEWLFNDKHSIAIEEQQYNIYHFPHYVASTRTKKGETYIFMDISMHPLRLTTMEEYFPVLRPFIQDLKANKFAAMLDDPLVIPAKVRQMLLVIFEISHENTLFDMVLRQQMVNLLFTLLVDISTHTPEQIFDSAQVVGKMSLIERLIRKQLHIAPDTEQLAQAIAVSKSKLLKDFKKLFGMPPGSYWRHLRMQKAASLLIESDKSVKEISAAIGFSSDSSFIAAFKQSFNNLTPEEYRKRFS